MVDDSVARLLAASIINEFSYNFVSAGTPQLYMKIIPQSVCFPVPPGADHRVS